MTSTRTPLSREQIVTAALDIIDAGGVEGLTMRRLGQRLGVDPMAVYHHMPNKGAVLDGVVEHIWRGVVMPPVVTGESWQDVLIAVFTAFRTRLHQHPRAVSVVGMRPSVTPAMLELIDTTLGRIVSAGLDGSEAMQLIDCLSGYTIGKVIGEHGLRSDPASAPTSSAGVATAVAGISPHSHPHLAHALGGGYDLDDEQEFQRGLRAMVAGWQGTG